MKKCFLIVFCFNIPLSQLFRDEGVEFQGGVGIVDDAVGVALRAEMDVAGADGVALVVVEDGGVAFGDEQHLATLIVDVVAYRGSGLELPLHDAVGAIEIHVYVKLLLSSLEVGDVLLGDLVKLNFHRCFYFMISFFPPWR